MRRRRRGGGGGGGQGREAYRRDGPKAAQGSSPARAAAPDGDAAPPPAAAPRRAGGLRDESGRSAASTAAGGSVGCGSPRFYFYEPRAGPDGPASDPRRRASDSDAAAAVAALRDHSQRGPRKGPDPGSEVWAAGLVQQQARGPAPPPPAEVPSG